MRIKLEELVGAVDRIRVFIPDAKKENSGVLVRLDKANQKALFAYADGSKAVCSNTDITIEEELTETTIVLSFKLLSEAVEIMKPLGVVKVDDVEILLDAEKKVISLSAEKYITTEAEDGSGEPVNEPIATMARAFAYTTMETDKRLKILECVDYDKMLSIADAGIDGEDAGIDSWNKKDFTDVMDKVTTEEGQMVIFSGKNKNVRVSNVAFAVNIPREEVNTSFCVGCKLAKSVVEILKKSSCDDIDIKATDVKATVCTSDRKVAVWFDTAKPLSRVINILKSYGEVAYTKHNIVVLKDAFTNIIKCIDSDVTNIELSFTGNDVDGFIMNVGGGSNTAKTNKFNVKLADVQGENAEILGRSFTINSDTVRAIIALCDTPYIGIDVGTTTDGSAWVMRISEIFKDAGVVQRNIECYSMISMK